MHCLIAEGFSSDGSDEDCDTDDDTASAAPTGRTKSGTIIGKFGC